MLQLAKHIVEQKEGEFQPEAFVDHYEEALIEVIKKKQAHEPLLALPLRALLRLLGGRFAVIVCDGRPKRVHEIDDVARRRRTICIFPRC